MTGCSQAAITDAAFFHIQGIRALNMSYCSQTTITDAAFAHLKGIKHLDMTGCSQATITDAAFQHLTGIQTLGALDCTQLNESFLAYIVGVKRLNIGVGGGSNEVSAYFIDKAGFLKGSMKELAVNYNARMLARFC
jgi:hypothetical protein